MACIHPHINFNGNAEAAFTFYQGVFGGALSQIMRFKDFAAAQGAEGIESVFEADEADKLMHIALSIGPNFLMGNDVPRCMGAVNEQENRSKIVVMADSQHEADQLYAGLSEGGTVECPIGPSPWGSYFAMLRDRFGIEWMIEYIPKSIQDLHAPTHAPSADN